MIRILHIIQSIDPSSGGPIAGVRQLAAADTHCRHELLSLDDPQTDLVRTEPLPVTALGPSGILGYTPRLVPWLRQHAHDYDCVMIHGLWRYHSFGTWRALRGLQTPYFVQVHGMLDPWFNEQYPFKRLKKNLFWPWSEYRVLRDARAVIFTCEDERLRSSESFRPYATDCEEIIGFGIDPPPVEASESRNIFLKAFPHLADKRRLLYLGRMHPVKGCDLLIEAFARCADHDPSLHLVMAGPGTDAYALSLRAQAVRLGIADRITWTGMLAGPLKWGAYHAAEIFVLPSHHENFGIVVIEAMACGIPVLVSDKVQIWRDVVTAGAGLAEPDDTDGTIRLLRRWLELTPIEGQAMADQANAMYQRRYRTEFFISKFHDLLNKHLVRHPSILVEAPVC